MRAATTVIQRKLNPFTNEPPYETGAIVLMAMCAHYMLVYTHTQAVRRTFCLCIRTYV